MERRRQERYELDVPIKVSRYDGGRCSTLDASSRDISSAGVYMTTGGAKFEKSQKVHLELTLTIEKLKELFGSSGMVKLEVDGSVVRTLGDGMVVKFDGRYSIFPLET